MTSDLFYGFAGEIMENQLVKPECPVKERVFRSDYTVCDAGLSILNGPNLFNRPLFTPGCRTFITVGDRPAFILWTNNHYKKKENADWGIPDCLGYCYLGLRLGKRSKWLHEFDSCETVYHPGWVEYSLRDSMFTALAIRIDVIPHVSGAVFLYIHIKTDETSPPAESEIIWSYGCLTYEGTAGWVDNFDLQSRVFPWDQPEIASNDSISFVEGFAVLKDSEDPANWVAVGTYPVSDELQSVDAEKRLKVTPMELLHCPADEKPLAAGRIVTKKNTLGFDTCILLNWGRNTDAVKETMPLLENWQKCIEQAKGYFDARSKSITIATPNKELDTVFKFNAVALDSLWNAPGINHGAYSWGGLAAFFRNYYGLTCCGDHERVRSALSFHCGLDEKGRLRNLAGSSEEKPIAAMYESYGSILDMLWHHYLWTGDRETLKNWVFVIDGLLDYEEANRKDANGLFVDHLGFWASDSFDYENGCAVGTTFVWLMYTVRGRIAEALNADPTSFYRRADEIKSVMFSTLWNEEGGYFYDSLHPDGNRIPSPIAPAIYHPIEFGLTEKEESERMMDYLLERLTSPEGLVKVNDWYPIHWSQNLYSPMDTLNAAIAAYKLKCGPEAYQMLMGAITGALHRAVTPGSISCHCSSTGISRNGTDFGDGVSLFLRTVVEGLFGIRMNVPNERVEVSPNFPSDWEKAEISLPDMPLFQYEKIPSGSYERIQIKIQLRTPLNIRLVLPVSGYVQSVRANGVTTKFKINNDRIPSVKIDLQQTTECKVNIDYNAGEKLSPSSIRRQTDSFPTMPCVAEEPLAYKNFEYVNLENYYNIAFTDIGNLYPEELLWGLDWYGKDWRCQEELALCEDHILYAGNGVPFFVDGSRVTAVRKKPPQMREAWSAYLLKINQRIAGDIPESLTIAVNKPADDIYLLVSGLCSPMTCHLPQLEIKMIYHGGVVKTYSFTSPDDFDFISQHTTNHSAKHLGWFGPEERMAGMQGDLERRKILMDTKDLLNPYIMLQQLHADVIRLNGMQGVLKEIAFKPLQSQSGVVLHGITLVCL